MGCSACAHLHDLASLASAYRCWMLERSLERSPARGGEIIFFCWFSGCSLFSDLRGIHVDLRDSHKGCEIKISEWEKEPRLKEKKESGKQKDYGYLEFIPQTEGFWSPLLPVPVFSLSYSLLLDSSYQSLCHLVPYPSMNIWRQEVC